MRSRNVECASATGQNGLKERKDTKDRLRIQSLASADVQMPPRIFERRGQRWEGHKRLAPECRRLPFTCTKHTIGKALHRWRTELAKSSRPPKLLKMGG